MRDEVATPEEFRRWLADYLDRQRERIAWLTESADGLLIEAIGCLDDAARLRFDPHLTGQQELVERLEKLAADCERIELEFRERARATAEDIAMTAAEGTYLARQMDVSAELLPLVASAEASGLDPLSVPHIARLDKTRQLLNAEADALRELRQGASGAS